MSAAISSVRVQAVGGHDHLTVFNRGACAGTLIVQAGDGDPVAELLLAGDQQSVPTIRVLSRTRAERYVPQGDGEVCISITTPGDPSAPAKLSERFADVLRLEIVDCDDRRPSPGYTGGWLTPEDARDLGGIVFDDGHAVAVLAFAIRYRAAPVVVVHCDAGWSRSPGVE